MISKYPDFSFWLFLNIYFDPGGFIFYYLGGRVFSGLIISDIAIVMIILCLYSIKTNYKIIYKDVFLMKFFRVFLIFAAYFFVFYGGIVPYIHNDLNYLLFLQKTRSFIYYIIIFTSVYIFALRDLKYFYFITLFLGLIILSAFFVSVNTGLNIVPVTSMERYEGSEMIRMGIYSWGLFNILFPLSFILFLFSRKTKFNIKYKKLMYLAGILMVVILLIGLSRRSYISIPGTIFIIVLLYSYVFRKSKVFAFTKIFAFMSIVLLIVYLVLPKYVNYIADISQDTFLLLTRGTDTRGEKDYRVSGSDDLLLTKKYIAENLILGTGYTYISFGRTGNAETSRGSEFSSAMDAAGEVPIYFIFFSYGLAGFVIFIFLYSFLIRLFLRLYSLVKKRFNILIAYPYDLLFVVLILFIIVDKFTFSLYSVGIDFTSPYYGIFIAIGFALLKKLRIITSNIESSPSSPVDIKLQN